MSKESFKNESIESNSEETAQKEKQKDTNKELLRKEVLEKLSPEAKVQLKKFLVRACDWEDNPSIDDSTMRTYGLRWSDMKKQLFEKTSQPIQFENYARRSNLRPYSLFPRDLIRHIRNYEGERSSPIGSFTAALDLLYSGGCIAPNTGVGENETHMRSRLSKIAERFSQAVERVAEKPQDSKEDSNFVHETEAVIANATMPDEVEKVLNLHKDTFKDYKPPIDHQFAQ